MGRGTITDRSGKVAPRDCHVLYVIGQLHSGGSERQLYYLLRCMCQLGYRPEVVVWNYRERDVYVPLIRSLGVPIHPFHPESRAVTKMNSLSSLIRRTQPQIVQSFSFYLNVVVAACTRRTTSVAIGGMRSALALDKKVNGSVLGLLSARWPPNQVYNSKAAAAYASRSHDTFVPKKIFVVSNGIDLDEFRPEPLPRTQTPRMIAIGSLIPIKRLDRLLGAAALLRRRGLEFSLEIAGDGPLRAVLRQHAEDVGLTGAVTFSGYSPDVPSLLARSTLLVHSSDAEGTPNAVMEAMACGRAVVATDVGDVSSIIDNGKTGFVVPPSDGESFAQHIATLITDPNRCAEMGKAGRERAEQEFGLSRMANEMLAVYQTVTSANCRRGDASRPAFGSSY
jgi:glycosyltransferase involved in cell wall biosynthesis